MSAIEYLKKIPIFLWPILFLAIFCYIFWRKYKGKTFELEVKEEFGQEIKMTKEAALEQIFFGAFLTFLAIFLILSANLFLKMIKKEGEFFPPELLNENIAPTPPLIKTSFPLPPKIEKENQ